MSKLEANTPVALETMLDDGSGLIIKKRKYTIKPIALKDIDKFINDNLSLDTQIFNIANSKTKSITEKWLSDYCFDEKGEPMTLNKVAELGWDIVDLKKFFRKLCDLSD